MLLTSQDTFDYELAYLATYRCYLNTRLDILQIDY